MQCFEKYETCVKGFLDEKGKYIYNIPAKKSKIYTYVESLRKTKSEEDIFKKCKDFLYENPEYWNLDSEHLNSLKTFVLKHIAIA